jgi:hypothetical protein
MSRTRSNSDPNPRAGDESRTANDEGDNIRVQELKETPAGPAALVDHERQTKKTT